MWVLEKIFRGLVLDLLEEAASANSWGKRICGSGNVHELKWELEEGLSGAELNSKCNDVLLTLEWSWTWSWNMSCN